MECLQLDHLVEEQVLTKGLPSSSLDAELDRVSEGVTGAAGETERLHSLPREEV